MKRFTSIRWVLPLAALGLIAADQPPATECLDSVRARQAVREQNLRQLPDAMMLARQKIRGDIVSADLCRIHGTMVYVFAIMGDGGRVHRLQIEAKSALAAQ